ncbi:TetR family transcriptional regulator [Actinopolyspora erythraea]|uniref:TetR family transcriptional regulator n=1 Tax=Actinopolyspora erythraea TaxID=414996 RepID=A0A099D986_9ACTN|nr:TetR/AcrR family transcriptional regulator [Actinopolyspora erythraea]ASU80592.1 TetR family transcriptional regulator [Actinopolyspora erythraea]KGI82728.1 TetR family transcriptional regulator [Actinopolyspora erythraea]
MTRGDKPAEHPDGRRAKGERRRREIIDATLRVIERDGTPRVSHRNIAREAGVPPASVVYYFESIDGVLIAALLESCETMIAELRALTERVVDDPEGWANATAEMLSRMVREQRGRTLAEYELYLLAARRPALRPAARRWIEVAAGYVHDTGTRDTGAVSALLAAIDGLLMQALIAEEPPGPEAFRPALAHLVPDR